MNAQGRGHAGDVDPADQWVFNPNTSSYTMRLNQVAGDSRSRSGSSRPDAPRQERTSDADGDRLVPSQRGGGHTEPLAMGGHRSGGRGRRKHDPSLSRKQKVLRWSAGTLGFIVVVGGTVGYFLYDHFNGNINKVDVGITNEAVTDGPVNILVIGTDTRRARATSGYGDPASVGHADTTFLFHVSKDRTNATALSIPRDMVTDIPNCPTKQKDGSSKVIPGQQGVRFNTSLGQAGRDPGCTMADRREDDRPQGQPLHDGRLQRGQAAHHRGRRRRGLHSPRTSTTPSRISTSRRASTSSRASRLWRSYVRGTRSASAATSTGSRLQQQFLSSMIRKMKSGGTLTNPSKLFDLANAATKALTVDTGIGSVKKLADLAKDLQRVEPEEHHLRHRAGGGQPRGPGHGHTRRGEGAAALHDGPGGQVAEQDEEGLEGQGGRPRRRSPPHRSAWTCSTAAARWARLRRPWTGCRTRRA